MSFSFNRADEEQISIFDSYNTLTDREKKALSKSWAHYFGDYIFPKIDEAPYAVLYSTVASRPNTPVNILIGALILKEVTGQSDDELLDSLMFDIRYQYALHTTSYQEQPLSDRSLSRFRERCNNYEVQTGIDLLHGTITSLSKEMAEIMKVDTSLKRMDSLMVASNIKRMGRLELLYTCVANLVKEMHKAGDTISEKLIHYTQDDDRNLVIYHNHSEETASKIETILTDAASLLKLCGDRYDSSSNYKLLLRILAEQAVLQEDGSYRFRTKQDGGMNGSILQNPSDPDATFRSKAGNKNRGYVANVTEATGENGSIVMDYQYEQNTYSDSQFLKDAIEAEPADSETKRYVTDGAYASKENTKLAEDKDIELVTTNLTGRESEDILAEFEFSEDGRRVIRCPGGYAPKSCSYIKSSGQCVVSFAKGNCEKCPHFDRCHSKKLNRVCRKYVSQTGHQRAISQRERSSEDFKHLTRFRNGVETIPSMLRRRHNIDHMPVRGYTKTKFLFGCKIAALNVRKFCRGMQNMDKCALIPANA